MNPMLANLGALRQGFQGNPVQQAPGWPGQSAPQGMPQGIPTQFTGLPARPAGGYLQPPQQPGASMGPPQYGGMPPQPAPGWPPSQGMNPQMGANLQNLMQLRQMYSPQ